MNMKKVITWAIALIMIIGLIASYTFTGLSPVPSAPAPTDQTTTPTPPPSASVPPFKGPTDQPHVNGPTSPPPQN